MSNRAQFFLIGLLYWLSYSYLGFDAPTVTYLKFSLYDISTTLNKMGNEDVLVVNMQTSGSTSCSIQPL